jgi:tRNA nucleotidyltransferase (CCA-adding enzyme)
MEIFLNHPHWAGVQEVAKKLHENGHMAWLAGGSVRDLLLDRTPTDFDIATDATPDVVEHLVDRAVTVGKAYGVIAVPFIGYQVEITTFRSDGEYVDGRHPENVTYGSPEADAQRRDFTVNAMFFDLKENKVIDYVDGQTDLEAKLIRRVGDPKKRFSEDYLRLLRAVRFATQLKFEIEPATWDAVCEMSGNIECISSERVRDEWSKLIMSDKPSKGIQMLDYSNLWQEVFPTWQGHQAMEHWQKMLMTVDRFKDEDLEFRMTCLCAELLQVLWDDSDHRNDELVNDVANQALQLVKLSLWPPDELPKFEKLAKVMYIPLDEHWHKMIKEAEPLPQPWLKGDDLKELGVKPGAQMGKILKEAYMRQLERLDVSHEEQLEWVKKQI